MCGIAGVYHWRDQERPVDRSLLRAMTQRLAHRGPDGEGIWTAAGVGLGHRRLAILDLTDRGRQPMADAAGELLITYNGEIYNFRELRRELEAKGHRFRSTGDTEVLLVGYREWGLQLLDRLSGIFAFALWDSNRKKLFLARDPYGVKPLFYAEDATTFRFASEIKAILADPAVAREFDLEALDRYFTFSYTPAPATGLKPVRQLLPGHAALVTAAGVSTWRYWTSPFLAEPRETPFTAAVGEFTELLERVTRSQLVSDVPVVGFLSGGLDSAALLRAMRQAAPDSTRALTVGFDVKGFDERASARATARHLRVPLAEVLLHLDATALIPELSRHLEEPTADSSSLPVYLLCREASRSYKVAIAGDGADELLAGYETYRAARLARWYRRIPAPLRRALIGPLAKALPVSDRKYGLGERARRFVYGAELGPELDHCAWRVIFTEPLKDELYSPGFRAAVRAQQPLRAYAAPMQSLPRSRDSLTSLLKADLEFYLPNDMLVKVDRMSMAHGLEVRVPYLDIDMVRFCANLPSDHKLHRGTVRKHILRESLRPHLPSRVLEGPKSGFNIPLGPWMRGPLTSLLRDAIATRRDGFSDFLAIDRVEAAIAAHEKRQADHGHALFSALMFALWLDNLETAWKPATSRSSETAPAPETAISPGPE